MKTVIVTGARGFVGRNLCVRLGELGDAVRVIQIGREDGADALRAAAQEADFVFHLAGVNRPSDEGEFALGNPGLTRNLCDALAQAGNTAPIVLSSSTQAAADNPYGRSKREAEDVVFAHAQATGATSYVFRLTNVFGKWARPNYNSAVATFCNNVARGLPIAVNDPSAPLNLVYIDDVVDHFIALLNGSDVATGYRKVDPAYATTVGAVADAICGFPESRGSLVSPRVGTGLIRALYSTYLSYLPTEAFDYTVPVHGDPRGVFVEMLKTPDAGQFSYFTAGPGITRGDHYHHTKAEKFLVIAGTAHFGFRHILSGERHEVVVKGGEARIVETIPGWTHNITNIGDDELIVMLWANEIFDRARPDTIALKV
ncbi:MULTISPECIES: UDP-2-acetamido-2,6-beta-L-arabino-hexul-4-ose reductase [unclassified Sphingomonas]|uniref:UDP-2-acetamido-2,6-beta-L-arabino-hexul-4-ose reductase n=1 Tax=unclassified Sphingomonas TaxID=196159 RepID=UPI002151E9D3|nr:MULTISPECIES: NAD-dependent epimerase/dehydratase family protein [unclassified Sphingomonas]MCR5871131.1 NAD-dependent epimerase/dehydratase family protein [Sphingomonas sp. J344]UUY00557.1 NAD-dependent epimerase/dehydratase family protein [Sphingomonas sp. J315]